MLRSPDDVKRPAGYQYQYDGLTGSSYGLKGLFLIARQVKSGARSGFSIHVGGFAHDCDYHVGASGCGYGLLPPSLYFVWGRSGLRFLPLNLIDYAGIFALQGWPANNFNLRAWSQLVSNPIRH
jgi:hypothetical protein